ncbi:MAG TPA: DUF6036 family nucleotidyltransferase [Longimicrobiaceae bacterium]|nr:DUF6036 family nucleotidyltransferase [Longimicrobiaceae bacterium]
MTRDQLEHAIRAACDVADDTEVWVFGSQAILGQFPDAPNGLRRSFEADIAPVNHPERVDRIDGALGEGSLFHRTHGFYVHGVPIETAKLPLGWEVRVHAVRHPVYTRGNTGWCVEAHDLAASKLIAYRAKDRDFVRLLLAEDLISGDTLVERLEGIAVEPALREQAVRWTRLTLRELSPP